MINDTNQTPVVPAMHVFRLVEIHRDPDRVFPAETSEHSRNAAGMDGTGASGGIALLSKGVFDAYERALQCLATCAICCLATVSPLSMRFWKTPTEIQRRA